MVFNMCILSNEHVRLAPAQPLAPAMPLQNFTYVAVLHFGQKVRRHFGGMTHSCSLDLASITKPCHHPHHHSTARFHHYKQYSNILSRLPPGAAAAIPPSPATPKAPVKAATRDIGIVYWVGVEQVGALEVVNEQRHILQEGLSLDLLNHLHTWCTHGYRHCLPLPPVLHAFHDRLFLVIH